MKAEQKEFSDISDDDGFKPIATTKEDWDDLKLAFKLTKEHGALLFPIQAAQVLGVSRSRIYQMIKAGQLTVFEIMGKQVLSGKEIEALLKNQEERRVPGYRWQPA